jgi:hypothetical protein
MYLLPRLVDGGARFSAFEESIQREQRGVNDQGVIE